MKIRTARKILKIWDCQTDKRFYESDDIKDGKRFRHFANLYRKANIRWNKANDPQANVSIFKAIIRNAKSCEHCARYEAFQAYGKWSDVVNLAAITRKATIGVVANISKNQKERMVCNENFIP